MTQTIFRSKQRRLSQVIPFTIGRIYDRKRDIHRRFGGQERVGISTPRKAPFIVLFTGETGEQYGYRDEWLEDGVFRYTGEGQKGDMTFKKGNKAIRDHVVLGKDLLLFKARGKRKGIQFVGRFSCSSYEWGKGPDKDGIARKIILFHLVQEGQGIIEPDRTGPPKRVSLDRLRRKALRAAGKPIASSPRKGMRRYYERSKDVRDYVLARADGVCESCRKPAPFKRSDGSPYLEPHHIRRLSDGGLDDIRCIASVCPNCHREAHYGVNRKKINQRMMRYVEQTEKDSGEDFR